MDDDDWPALAAFAYDDEFLYIAVTCRRAPGLKYEPAQTPRPRDADLTAQDHVDVLIDVDRDFATYYQLSFDYRGFTADSLWGDPAWNPTWFVAADLTDEAWTVEAAVPLNQLTGGAAGALPAKSKHTTGKMPAPPVASRDVWALGVQRTVPGGGFSILVYPRLDPSEAPRVRLPDFRVTLDNRALRVRQSLKHLVN